jgi:hypothetical protein
MGGVAGVVDLPVDHVGLGHYTEPSKVSYQPHEELALGWRGRREERVGNCCQ